MSDEKPRMTNPWEVIGPGLYPPMNKPSGQSAAQTPETDASTVSSEYIRREMDYYTHKFILADIARKLERERNEARRYLEKMTSRCYESARRAEKLDVELAAAKERLAVRNALLNDLREALDHCEENQSIIPAYWIDAIDEAMKNG